MPSIRCKITGPAVYVLSLLCWVRWFSWNGFVLEYFYVFAIYIYIFFFYNCNLNATYSLLTCINIFIFCKYCSFNIFINDNGKMSWWFGCLKVYRLHCFTAKQHPFGTVSLRCRPSPLRLQRDRPSGTGHALWMASQVIRVMFIHVVYMPVCFAIGLWPDWASIIGIHLLPKTLKWPSVAPLDRCSPCNSYFDVWCNSLSYCSGTTWEKITKPDLS